MIPTTQQITVTLNLTLLTQQQVVDWLHSQGYKEYGTKSGNVADPNWNSDLTKFYNAGNTVIQIILVDLNMEIIGWRCQ